MTKKILIITSLLLFLNVYLFSQIPTSGMYTDYYNYLSIDGTAESNTIMYHSFSANSWSVKEDHLWSNSLGDLSSIALGAAGQLVVLPTRLELSGNTTYARKELSDGAWWQGRGVNSFLTGGVQWKSEHFQITLMPELWFAQNLPFDILPTALPESDGFGYFVWSAIDYPQRFGDDPLFEYGWGQSEVRANWKNLTLGFGTENILAGPSKVFTLMFSDSAAGFPHIDFGLKKTPTAIGNIELRGFRGRVEESEYYDDDASNDYNFLHGIILGYEPSFVPGLSFGIKWSLMATWQEWQENWMLQAFGFNFGKLYFGGDAIDQKGAITLQYKFPEVGFEWYFEFFREDYSPSIRFILLEPGHSAGYTVGMQKKFEMEENEGLLVTFEWNELIQSRDYEIDNGVGGTYYTHGSIRQGFTHQGQLLGAGIGPGADAQTLLLDYYTPWGKLGGMIQRIGWNKDYLYRDPVTRYEGTSGYVRLDTEMNFGLNSVWMISKSMHLFADTIFSYRMNYNYTKGNDKINFYGNVGMNYRY